MSAANALQVSDRFHLLKNLNERATQVFQRLFQRRVTIPITDETARHRAVLRRGTAAERALTVTELHAQGRSDMEIATMADVCDETIKRWAGCSSTQQTVRGREHEAAVHELQARADRIRGLAAQGFSIAAIVRETGFSSGAVKRYLSDEFTPVNGHYGKQREGKLEPFREQVLKLREGGLKYREIHAAIAAQGYTGTQDAIRGFLSKESRIGADMAAAHGQAMELIDKKWLVRLLYKPLDKVKGISQDQLSGVLTMYPLAGTIYALVNGFKALMRTNEPNCLLEWMEQATAHGIAEIDTFINGLSRDIDAVANAIRFDYNNGLAEGSVNKLKLIKRTVYGRCSFDLLRSKTLLLEKYIRLN